MHHGQSDTVPQKSCRRILRLEEGIPKSPSRLDVESVPMDKHPRSCDQTDCKLNGVVEN